VWAGEPLPHSGRVCEYEQALVAGEPVVVHAGLPSDDYAFGGRHWGKKWLLDVDGTLSEWTGEDAEAEASS